MAPVDELIAASPDELPTARPGLRAIAIAIPECDVHRRVELPEHLGRYVEAGQHARCLDDDGAVAADLGADRRLGRDVAPPEILRERAPDNLPVDRRIERLE